MALAVKHDLERMKPKVLPQVEQKIVENEVSPIEGILCSKLRQPMKSLSTQAQEVDRRIDHLTEAQLPRFFLSCPSSQQIIEALYQRSSVQQAAQTALVPAQYVSVKKF